MVPTKKGTVTFSHYLWKKVTVPFFEGFWEIGNLFYKKGRRSLDFFENTLYYIHASKLLSILYFGSESSFVCDFSL